MIGTGNTAVVLSRKMKAAGHRIVQVMGRNKTAAEALAAQVDSTFSSEWIEINENADVYIIAVSDCAISEVAKGLNLHGKKIVHTAGAVSIKVLQPYASHYGVFYPLQTLSKSSEHLPEIPVVIDASDEATLQILETLAQSISVHVEKATDEDRARMHLAAVFCNNFTNHLYALADQFCKKEGIQFSVLLPLIEETAVRLRQMPASTSQTGPAVRNDTATIDKHLALLEKYPQLQLIYSMFTKSIAEAAGQ
jgi:predicted short-subunit dehydrogenase-like oxidoreductase (DUF2520 family)